MAPEPIAFPDPRRRPIAPPVSPTPNPAKTAHLIGAVYDTVHDEALWGKFLEAFLVAVSAERGSLLLRDLQRPQFSVMRWHGWTEEDLKLYAERYAAEDPWNVRAQGQPSGVIVTDEEYCPRAEMEASAAFREFYGPRGCYHGFGGMVFSSPEMEACIAVTRSRSKGRFSEAELGVLRELMPHLQRVVALQCRINRLQMLNSAFASQVNGYPHGFLLLDCERRVAYQNGVAEKLLKSGDGLRMEEGRLTASRPEEDAEVERAVTSCFVRTESARAVVTCGGNELRLMFFPQNPGGIGTSLAAVVFANVRPTQVRVPELLKGMFGLTKAEAQVAISLADGLNIREIAKLTDVSVETIRTHLRHAMAKTGTNRQGALVSLILKCTSNGV